MQWPLRWFRMHVHGCLIALVALVSLTLGWGCETAPKAGAALETALKDYEAGRYESAHEHAVQSMRQNGQTRHEAAYLAGLSAFQMNDRDEAELRFRAAARSDDRVLAARANAMLGQIRLEQNRPREAAWLFEAASRDLSGEEHRQASRYAALAHREAGDRLAAERWERRSPVSTPSISESTTTLGSSSPPARPAAREQRTGLFSLQVGAFNERERAERAARIAQTFADREQHGRVRIIPTQDERGRSLYLVQFGDFDTRISAAVARERLGRLDYIVAPTAQASH